MEWEFTPQQVVRGEAAYGLPDFRDDLAQEIRKNLGDAGPDEFGRTYSLIYDLCYWLATGRSFEDFSSQFKHDPPTLLFLQSVNENMNPNVQMLGAILQRLIMDRVEQGTNIEQAVQEVAKYHEVITGGGTTLTPGAAIRDRNSSGRSDNA